MTHGGKFVPDEFFGNRVRFLLSFFFLSLSFFSLSGEILAIRFQRGKRRCRHSMHPRTRPLWILRHSDARAPRLLTSADTFRRILVSQLVLFLSPLPSSRSLPPFLPPTVSPHTHTHLFLRALPFSICLSASLSPVSINSTRR